MRTELAVVEDQHHGLSMVDGPDPMAATAYAASISKAIASVLKEKNGYVNIQGRKHVEAAGWQTIAAMTGHTCEVEWSRIVEGLEDGGLHAWEARAIVRDQAGRIVAAGDSMASPTERVKLKSGGDGPPPWARAEFSIRSMAQTRAISRALASRMRYVVQLAGFAGAPAEEMSDADREGAAIQVARDRWKVLREEAEADNDAVKLVVGDDPTKLAHDEFFANAAVRLGFDKGYRMAKEQGADPEGEAVEGEVVEDHDTGEVISDSQRKRLLAIAREVGATNAWVKSVVLDLTGQDSRSKIPVGKYEAVIDAIQAGPPTGDEAVADELFPATATHGDPS